MRFRNLSELKRPEPSEIRLATLPREITIARYAMEKAFKICELVKTIYNESYEWYGFTVADRDNPRFVVDIGLPGNDQNVHQYTGIGPQKIADYQDSLPPHVVINGWIHSHGRLPLRDFSTIDNENHLTVLDYVTALLRKPVAKREVVIRDLVLLVKGQYAEEDLIKGNVSIISDVPLSEVMIMETVYGGFSYGIVIGDGGWHRQEIHYKRRGVLTGQTSITKNEAEAVVVETGRSLAEADIAALIQEIKDKIEPIENPPPERME